jgi:hypothetical protein
MGFGEKRQIRASEHEKERINQPADGLSPESRLSSLNHTHPMPCRVPPAVLRVASWISHPLLDIYFSTCGLVVTIRRPTWIMNQQSSFPQSRTIFRNPTYEGAWTSKNETSRASTTSKRQYRRIFSRVDDGTSTKGYLACRRGKLDM